MALTGHSGVKYFTGGIFSKLTFTLGLADHPSSLESRIDLDFSVETAPEWLDNFSEDMEYGTCRRKNVRLTSASRCEKVTADISGGATLVLASRSKPYIDRNGAVAFAIPHIGIAEAVLHI